MVKKVDQIQSLRCVSEDIVTYTYLNKYWKFHLDKCVIVGDGKVWSGEMHFVFVAERGTEAEQPWPWPQHGNLWPFASGGVNICFAPFDSTKKVSNAKRYKISCPAGGFLRIDGNITAFTAGAFEFVFKKDKPAATVAWENSYQSYDAYE